MAWNGLLEIMGYSERPFALSKASKPLSIFIGYLLLRITFLPSHIVISLFLDSERIEILCIFWFTCSLLLLYLPAASEHWSVVSGFVLLWRLLGKLVLQTASTSIGQKTSILQIPLCSFMEGPGQIGSSDSKHLHRAKIVNPPNVVVFLRWKLLCHLVLQTASTCQDSPLSAISGNVARSLNPDTCERTLERYCFREIVLTETFVQETLHATHSPKLLKNMTLL